MISYENSKIKVIEASVRESLINYIKAFGVSYENFDNITTVDLMKTAADLVNIEDECKASAANFNREIKYLQQPIRKRTFACTNGKIGKVFKGK